MAGINRTEILRRDCPKCHGKGYTTVQSSESSCDDCGGSGMLEKVVPFKFDGKRTPEETAEVWGVPIAEIKDSGHDAGDAK